MAEEESFLNAKALVVDNGTGISKNGFAGEDQPRSVFPTLIGYPKYESIMTDVGHDILKNFLDFSQPSWAKEQVSE